MKDYLKVNKLKLITGVEKTNNMEKTNKIEKTNMMEEINMANEIEEIDNIEDTNVLCITGYDDETCESVDISGTINANHDMLKKAIHDQLPWIEKFRPKNIEDVILDENILTKIKKIISEKNMPNLIITGIPGVGKTTTIRCIAHGLYGRHRKDAVLELNASDDRGIKTVDDSITNFCKKAFTINNGKSYAKHKMIILDEADNITTKAQHSINKKMTEYNETTRFAFTCNESTDIIKAIQSRCIILRFLRLSTNKVVDKLKYICLKEHIKYKNDAIEEIAIISQGDMRNAINNLQIVYNGLNEITIDNVYKVTDKPQPVVLLQILQNCKKMDVFNAFQITKNLKEKGYSDSDIILGMMNVLKSSKHTTLTEFDKNFIHKRISKTAFFISKGISSNLQLYGCLSAIMNDYKSLSMQSSSHKKVHTLTL